MFKGLELPLYACTPNTIRLFLGVDTIKRRIWLRIGIYSILDYYRLVVNNEKVYCTPTLNQSLMVGIHHTGLTSRRTWCQEIDGWMNVNASSLVTSTVLSLGTKCRRLRSSTGTNWHGWLLWPSIPTSTTLLCWAQVEMCPFLWISSRGWTRRYSRLFGYYYRLIVPLLLLCRQPWQSQWHLMKVKTLEWQAQRTLPS